MSTYEADPEWQAARAEWVRDRQPDETPTEHMLRGIRAVYAMYVVESRHEAGAVPVEPARDSLLGLP